MNLLNSPTLRTVFSSVIPIVVGILSGLFVAEITGPAGIQWADFYKKPSFYGLVLATIVTFLYYRALYIHDVSIEKFLDDDYCRAYVRSRCLPEAAAKYNEQIKSGDSGEFESAMRELEGFLKR